MKKQIAWMLTAVLATSGVTLAACGGNSGGASGGGEAQQEQQAEPVDPAEKFQGSWKLAAAEMEGVTVTGDLSGILDTEDTFSVTINADGTGTATLGDEEEGNFTWELKDDDTLTFTIEDEDADTDPQDLTYDAEREAVVLTMSDDEFTGSMFLTHDGTIEGVLDVDLAQATSITALDDVVGEWKLVGVGMGGMVMYGEAEDVSAAIGDTADVNISIAADGSATMADEDGSVSVGEDGATLTSGYMETPLKMLDDYLVLDMSDLFGSEFFMLYAK